jgi:hypothetical protein
MMSQDDDLTPAERNAFQSLAQRREPSRLLEERTVRALRAEGLLRESAGRGLRLPWLIAATAAGAVLYLGGIATGQWLAGRETSRMVNDLQRGHGLEAAALVQQTGSAYSQAIAALARMPDSDSLSMSQGREVALTALYSAANELVRLTPDDPVVVRILQVLDHDREGADSTPPETHRVVWF